MSCWICQDSDPQGLKLFPCKCALTVGGVTFQGNVAHGHCMRGFLESTQGDDAVFEDPTGDQCSVVLKCGSGHPLRQRSVNQVLASPVDPEFVAALHVMADTAEPLVAAPAFTVDGTGEDLVPHFQGDQVVAQKLQAEFDEAGARGAPSADEEASLILARELEAEFKAEREAKVQQEEEDAALARLLGSSEGVRPKRRRVEEEACEERAIELNDSTDEE
eukprot:TRINITY_DN4206_c0_g1_i6.p1 TRINITY_DN4206_c0_g1~~TRINITY_DN4206_c0_g1_i6.p1  ORF type:complete len:219 (-),score=54.02 TRINITY_DN4206_c0_g1_i6:46-702(-)